MFRSSRLGFLLMWPMTKEQHFTHSSQIWMYSSWKSSLITHGVLYYRRSPAHVSAVIYEKKPASKNHSLIGGLTMSSLCFVFSAVKFCPLEVWTLNSRSILFMLSKRRSSRFYSNKRPPLCFLAADAFLPPSVKTKKGNILQIKLLKSLKYPAAALSLSARTRLSVLSKVRRIKSNYQ